MQVYTSTCEEFHTIQPLGNTTTPFRLAEADNISLCSQKHVRRIEVRASVCVYNSRQVGCLRSKIPSMANFISYGH